MLYKLNDFVSPKKLEVLAKQTGFQKRTPKKITAYNFLLSFLNVYCTRRFSLRNWAQELSLICNQMVSFQAIHKKLTIRHLPFLQQVFALIISKNINCLDDVSPNCLSSFNRVLIEDSTCIKLSDSLYKHFSGSSNSARATTIARLQVCLDLRESKFENAHISSYSKNDMSYSSNILNRLKPKDLVIRDLGYWNTSVLSEIDKKQAYFISRLRNRAIIKDLNNDKYDLVSTLKSLDAQKETHFEVLCKLNNQDSMTIKLIASKVSCKQHKHRIRQAKKSRHKDSKIHSETHYLLSWEIYITNAVDVGISNTEIKKLYKLRWQIEMFFKNWKSNYNVQKLLKSSKGGDPIKPEILMYLSLIYIAAIYQPNYLKYRKAIANKFEKTLSPLKFGEYLKSVYKASMQTKVFINQLQKYCCYDTRKDRINMQIQLQKFGLS